MHAQFVLIQMQWLFVLVHVHAHPAYQHTAAPCWHVLHRHSVSSVGAYSCVVISVHALLPHMTSV
jgi:hypothetical protein